MARQPAKVVRSERLASRRRDVRRQNMRRRRRVTFGAVTVILCAAGGLALARSSLFDLEGIEVSGAKLLTNAEVVQASGLHSGQSMLSLSTDQVRSRIERLALVRSATVARVPTSRIRISIVERTPAFVLETIESRWLLDAESTLLDEVRAPVAGLPTIRLAGRIAADTGDRVRIPSLAEAVRLWGALPPALRKGPATIAASVPAGLELVHPDHSITFGTIDRIDEKLRAVVLVLDRLRRAGERVLSIDVRSPSRPAARLA